MPLVQSWWRSYGRHCFGFLSHVPLELPPVASQAAAVLVFLVIAHNQRGYLPAEGVVFRCL
jgi:hypothetical protein